MEIRYTENEKDRFLKVVKPCARVLKDAKEYASKITIKAMKNHERLSQDGLTKWMKEEGILTDKDYDDYKNNVAELDKILPKIERGGYKLKEALEDAKKAWEHRLRIFAYLIKPNDYLDKTYEGLQSDAQFDYICSKCILEEDGRVVFKSVDDIDERVDLPHFKEAAEYLQKQVYNNNENYFESFPEYKLLRKFDIINEDGSFKEEKTEEKVEQLPFLDDDGNPLE